METGYLWGQETHSTHSGQLTVHGQVDGLAAADTDRVPDLTLVGSGLLPADAMPSQHPAVGGQAEADGDGQGLAVEEPADLSRAGAAAYQAQGVSALHQLCAVGYDHGLGQDLCRARDRGGGGRALPATGASPPQARGILVVPLYPQPEGQRMG